MNVYRVCVRRSIRTANGPARSLSVCARTSSWQWIPLIVDVRCPISKSKNVVIVWSVTRSVSTLTRTASLTSAGVQRTRPVAERVENPSNRTTSCFGAEAILFYKIKFSFLHKNKDKSQIDIFLYILVSNYVFHIKAYLLFAYHIMF